MTDDTPQPGVTGADIIAFIADREISTEHKLAVKEAIHEHDDDVNGAPVGDVIETVLETENEIHLLDVSLALYGLAQNAEVYAPAESTVRLVANPDEEIATDGGQSEDVEHHPDGFTSGDHHVLDDHPPEPDPGDPAQWCYECGNEQVGMCGCCGMPLCGKHLELGAGFCSDRTVVDTRVGLVSACIRTLDDEIMVYADAHEFNYDRPQRQALPPRELEQAVRARLPDAVIEAARGHVQDAIDQLDQQASRRTCQRLLAAADGLRFASAATDEEVREDWLQRSARTLATCREAGDADWSIASDLSIAVGLLEQLGVDASDGGATEDE